MQDGYRLVVASSDLAVDQVRIARTADAVSPGKVRPLLKALSRCQDVKLDGVQVAAKATPVGAVARVTQVKEGYKLILLQDPGITEVFGNGMALKKEALHPVADLEMSRREVDELRKGRVFQGHQVAQLVTELIPYLKERVRLDIRAELPGLESETPRLEVSTELRDGQLNVLATLVYGDPPIARVDSDGLKIFGEKIPDRDHAEESYLVKSLRNALGLEVGRREVFEGEFAVAFAQKLAAWQGGNVLGMALESFFLAPRFCRSWTWRAELPNPLSLRVGGNGDGLAEVGGPPGEGGTARPEDGACLAGRAESCSADRRRIRAAPSG